MKTALRELLRDADTLEAIVARRVYWQKRDDDTGLPALVLFRIGGASDWTFDGPDSIDPSRVQINCLAETAGEADTLAKAVKALLNGHKSASFQGIFLQDEGDLLEATQPEQIHGVRLDFRVVAVSA